MGQRYLFDKDGDIVQTFEHDPMTGKFTIASHQNAAPYLEQNARCRAEGTSGTSMRMKGSIPFVLLEYLLRERGLTFHKWQSLGKQEHAAIFAKILDDRDYYKLRTSDKKGSLDRGIIIR